MSGRISVTQEGHGDIFRLRWTHRPATDSYSLVSPVGTELARIERGPQGYVAWRPGQAPVAVSEFTTLTQHLLGVALDERALVAWLHARTGVAQSAGWWVTLEESQQVDGVEIARRLTAQRDGVTMKLVVDSYRAIVP